MTEKRLNNCFLLHVHKELTDSINVTDVAVEFTNVNDERTRYLLVLCNEILFCSNEIIIILFPNMIPVRTFPISNNEYNYHFVPLSQENLSPGNCVAATVLP